MAEFGNGIVHAKSTKWMRSLSLFLLALAPLLATGCADKAAGKSSEGTGTMHVKVTSPHRQTLTREIEQPGYLKAYESTPIFAKIGGYVEEVKVDIGDEVKQGDLLAKLWIPEVVTDLKVKQARVEQSKADLKQSRENAKACKANVELTRNQILEAKANIAKWMADVERWKAEEVRAEKNLKNGIFDKQFRDEAHNQVKQSEAGEVEARAKKDAADAAFDESSARYQKSEADVEVAARHLDVCEAEYQQWHDWVDYSYIRAPYAGIVTLRNTHTGHFVQPSTSGSTNKAADPLFCVKRFDIMRVTIQVPEIDAALVREKDTAIVRLQALPGREINGKVTRDSWSLDEKARTLRVEVFLDNPKKELRPGMFANVVISATVPNALVLPTEAVMTDGETTYCMEVQNGVARRVIVDAGVYGNEGVQVFRKRAAAPKSQWRDFSGNEQIVTTNPGALLDGQRVEIENGIATH
jgi:RND family efflux transporter MFP subunit